MNTKLASNESVRLTEAEIRDLVTTWYHKLDVHAPIEELTPLLIEDGLRMVFPEMTAEGLAGIQQWYERVINIFFDEVHTVKEIKSTPKADCIEVRVIVKWEASRWNPPAPRSERIICDAYQTWEVLRSPVSNSPVILTYIVDSLKYYEESVRL